MRKLYFLLLITLLFMKVDVMAGGCVAPPAPTGLGSSGVACLEFQINWSNGGGTTTGYSVEVYTNAALTVPIAGSPFFIGSAATLSRLITGLTANTTYYFRVRAYNSGSGGCFGPYTGTANVTTSAPPGVVANAGADQTPAACVGQVTLAGSNPAPGTGLWTCTANCGSVVFSDATSPTSIAYIPAGTDPTLTWTVTQAGCGSTTDNVAINTTSNASCPTVCATEGNNCTTASMYMTSVTFGSMDHNSACNDGDGSGQCVTVIPGQTIPLTIATGPYSNAYQMSLGVYFDWNADGDFADAGEFTLINNDALAGTTYTTNITAPTTFGANCGKTIKFRVRLSYNITLTSALSCNDGSTYGEVETYCVTLSCPAPTCVDGVMNGTETGIDCGGSCPACTNDCFNGIQDGAETGVDCGAGCVPCTTNDTPVAGASTCNGAVQGQILLTNCDQIGTTAYEMNTPTVTFDPNAAATLPTALTDCGIAPTTIGEWTHLDLANGVTTLQAAWDNSIAATLDPGNSEMWSAVFQEECGTGSFVGCQQVLDVIMGTPYVFNSVWSGLDPTKDVWIYTFGSKDFNLSFEFTGSGGAPPEEACSTPNTGAEGCNLGAQGDTWASMPGATCGGSYNWGSNENTVYHTFTASETDGSLQVGTILCNDGGSGVAQFGVFRNCACVGLYTAACYFGCATGNGEMTLTALVPGNTYIIAVDGFAGDQCTWTFEATGIILPIELITLKATRYDNKNVIYWSTKSERECSHYEVERSIDGENWEYIGKIDGNGTTTETFNYYFYDEKPLDNEVIYYRLKQFDYNGKFNYQGPVVLKMDDNNIENKVVPNPVSDNAQLIFKSIRTSKQTISILDMTGRVLKSVEVDAKYGKNTFDFETNDFNAGSYLIRIDDGVNRAMTTKFMKN